ncbi:MAG: hypothetical protein K0R50_253 [Eubacterium sp.]|nr:hypothetical protein [Eubacterium sp.]
MDTVSEPIMALTARLKEVSLKNTAESIYDKVNLVKQKGNDQEAINVLEEIINDLTTDKNELIQITKCYEEEFSERDISDSDINYITRELLPILTSFLPFSGGNSEFISSIGKIFSAETLKILKLLGFNYKEAIGIPLTNLVSQAIQNQSNKFVLNKGSGKK